MQINESNLSNSEKEVAELSSSIIMESSKKKQRENVYNPKKKKIAYIELHETQTINFPVKGIKVSQYN